MPAGYVHFNMWKRWLPRVVALSIFFGILSLSVFYPAFFISGYILGLYIEPDLDQIAITSSGGRMLRHLKLLGAILLSWWVPYAYIFKHRGISHIPIVGTLTRWVWLGGILIFIFKPSASFWESARLWEFLVWGFIGNCLADYIHIGADFEFLEITIQDKRR